MDGLPMNVSAMLVELTFPGGQKHLVEAQAVMFVPTCKFEDCGREFRTPDPRKSYCCYECQEKAKYRRWKGR